MPRRNSASVEGIRHYAEKLGLRNDSLSQLSSLSRLATGSRRTSRILRSDGRSLATASSTTTMPVESSLAEKTAHAVSSTLAVCQRDVHLSSGQSVNAMFDAGATLDMESSSIVLALNVLTERGDDVLSAAIGTLLTPPHRTAPRRRHRCWSTGSGSNAQVAQVQTMRLSQRMIESHRSRTLDRLGGGRVHRP